MLICMINLFSNDVYHLFKNSIDVNLNVIIIQACRYIRQYINVFGLFVYVLLFNTHFELHLMHCCIIFRYFYMKIKFSQRIIIEKYIIVDGDSQKLYIVCFLMATLCLLLMVLAALWLSRLILSKETMTLDPFCGYRMTSKAIQHGFFLEHGI